MYIFWLKWPWLTDPQALTVGRCRLTTMDSSAAGHCDTIQISKKYVEKLAYFVNSVDIPLGVALVIATSDSTGDYIRTGTLNALWVGPFLLTVFLLGYRLLPNKDINVMTIRGQSFHSNTIRVLCVIPLGFTFFITHVEPPTFQTVASMTRQLPVWLGGLVARSWEESAILLTVHFTGVLLANIPDYWENVTNLVVLDFIIIVIAWAKGQFICLVDHLSQSLHASVSTLDEVKNMLGNTEQQRDCMKFVMLTTVELVNKQRSDLANTKSKLAKEQEKYAQMSLVAEAAVGAVRDNARLRPTRS